MPSLHILKNKGANEGAMVPLDGDRFVLGRNPDCGIVIPNTAVSREHAQILRIQGRFYIEDKQSRNGTHVNNQPITARTALKNNDKIRICDFLAAFLESLPGPAEPEAIDESDGSSTVEATLSASSNLLLETQPAEKLRGLLEISANLSKTLDLDALMPKIVESLFTLFRQADRCFVIQAEEGTKRLLPRVVRTRRATDEANARPSGTIVRRCLESAQAFLSDDASRDDRVQLSQSVVDFRIRSVMCVPLCTPEGKAFGVIQLDTQDRSKKFTQEDLKLLWGVANTAAIAMDNARLHHEAVARERLNRDLELAKQMQMNFLPRTLPNVPGYEFFAYYKAAQAVGGDYYGFVELPQGRLVAVVGDVAGKGVPAALMMSKLSSDARFCFLAETVPSQAVSKLNDFLYPFTSPMDRFITLGAIVLDPAEHTVTLVSAGHPAPILYRAATRSFQDAMPKSAAGVPLGMLEGYPYESSEVSLLPGDYLLMFSDGVTDALDVRNNAFGMKGIHRIVEEGGAVPPSVVGDRMVKALVQHATGRDAYDDITLVCLGRKG
jgi:sigma-B regulation protein RsbU (phosphoserine phosphatase)